MKRSGYLSYFLKNDIKYDLKNNWGLDCRYNIFNIMIEYLISFPLFELQKSTEYYFYDKINCFNEILK